MTKAFVSPSLRMVILIFTLSYWGAPTLTWGSKFQQRFLEDGELQSTAWEILKTLGGTPETNQSDPVTVFNSPEREPLSGSAISTEIFAFGEQVVSPSSSKQKKLGDLRSLVKQIKEQDEDTITAGAGGGGMGKGVTLASISLAIILLLCIVN